MTAGSKLKTSKCGRRVVRLDRSPSSRREIPLHALLRLALSPKVRGSGQEIDRVRFAQQCGFALVAHTALSCQKAGLEKWLLASTQDLTSIRAFACMWDEASQRTRARLRNVLTSKAQTVADIFVMLASVFEVRGGEDELDQWIWEAWISPPMLLCNVKHRTVLEALDRCMPFAFKDKETLLRFGKGARAALLSFCFDYVSSNVLAYRHMVAAACSLASSQINLLIHGERCLTHAIHIVKADGQIFAGGFHRLGWGF